MVDVPVKCDRVSQKRDRTFNLSPVSIPQSTPWLSNNFQVDQERF
ncbi:hypothetical protein [Nostoc sp.]